jgi:hypothetical protein
MAYQTIGFGRSSNRTTQERLMSPVENLVPLLRRANDLEQAQEQVFQRTSWGWGDADINAYPRR